MTIEIIAIGQTPNDKLGDPLRTAFEKVNRNFQTLENNSSPDGPDGAVQYRATNNLTAIALQSGTYVATGFPGRVFTSTDLTNWTAAAEPITTTLVALTTDTQLFIGVGASGTVATSYEGQYWTVRPTGVADDLLGVAFGNGVYIAVGMDGTILRSVDSEYWTIASSPTAENLTSVVYSAGQGVFVAVGTGGTIITSVDGTVWAQQISGIVEDLNSVTAINNQVLIAGNNGRILSSLDLFNWDVRTSGTIQNLLGIATAVLATTATAFAVGIDGTIVTSSDGGFITWDDITYTSPTTKTLTTVAGLDSTIVTIGIGGTIFTTTGGSWIDTGIPAGLDGSADLVFDAQSSTLSIDASIIPQSTATWDLGSDSQRWANAYFSANVTIGGVRLQADTTTFRPLLANGAIADIAGTNITANTITSNTAVFDSLSTNTFAVTTFTADTIVVTDVTTDTVTANTVTAIEFVGDGGNLTNLPVQSIIAGTNVTVSNTAGQWTISASGGGGNGTSNPSHLPLNSIQLADVDGQFTSTGDFIFDVANSALLLNGSITANTFTGNVVATTVVTQDSTVTGNLVAENVSFLGTVTIDTTDANSANLGNISIYRSNIYEFGSGTDTFTISSRVANILVASANSEYIGVDAATIDIRGGNAVGLALGGTVTIAAGTGGEAGTGADLNLFGGRGGNTGGDGGNINIIGGNAGSGATGGSINIISGTTSGDPIDAFGSNIYIQAGNTVSEDAGTLTLQGANAVGPGLIGGNIRITAGTGSIRNGNIFIGNVRWPNDQGLNNYVMTSDGVGSAHWSPINANIPVSLTISNIVNGTSNVSIANPSGNITFGVNGTANVLTVTNNTVRANSFTSNNFVLGNSTQTACSTSWFKGQTSTAVANQVLIEIQSSSQVSTDFKIITYDMTASTRQSSMITSVTYGPQTSYSEYARTVINTVIADFTVDQVGGKIRLLVSPRVAHLINYTVIVSTY